MSTIGLGRRSLLVAVAAVSLLPFLAGCQRDPLNPIGEVLASLENTVNGVLAEAGRQGQVLTVTAAGQVLLAAGNLESALATDLDKDIDKVDDAARRSIDDLRTLVAQLSSDSAQVLNSGIAGAQQLINSLPFTNKNPQVRSYTPRVATAAVNGPVQVTVDGNFFWASQQKLEVLLRAGGVTYKPNESTTARVGFALPADLFRRTPGGLDRVSLELVAPYEKGVVFKSRPLGVFHLLVTVLPTAPAKTLTLTNEVPVTGVEARTRTMPSDAGPGVGGWRLDSWDGCRDKEDTHTIGADPGGWTIDASSVTISYNRRTPDDIVARASVASAGPTGFVVEGHTSQRCFLGISSGSGSLIYYVSYTQFRQVTSSRAETSALPAMKWGDQIDVPVSRNKWRIRAELWNGAVVESSGAVTNNPYLVIEDRGDSVKVWFRMPANPTDD
jgi:hypothetical protein